jgi:hypothetical protein
LPGPDVGCERRGVSPSYQRRLQTPAEHPRRLMGDLLPGGYVFTHLVFWAVVAMVALGTNAVAIILMVGLGMLVLESFRRA